MRAPGKITSLTAKVQSSTLTPTPSKVNGFQVRLTASAFINTGAAAAMRGSG